MVKIKICGMTNKADAISASRLGADMLGFVFYKKSKRCVEAVVARDIISGLPASILKVGVFVDEEPGKVLDLAATASLDALQFHGSETPEYCAAFRGKHKVIKAFRLEERKDLKHINDYDVDLYLLDTFKSGTAGGTGKAFDWKIVTDFEFLRPVILSGGLSPKNVSRAIREVVPYGVDVSTGVEESPGKKDPELMKKFIEEARKA